MKNSELTFLADSQNLFDSEEYVLPLYEHISNLIGDEADCVIIPRVQTSIDCLASNGIVCSNTEPWVCDKTDKIIGIHTVKWIIIDSNVNGLRTLEDYNLCPNSWDCKYTYSLALTYEKQFAAMRALEDTKFEQQLEMYLRKKLDIRVNHKCSECSGSELEISIYFGQNKICSTIENID